MGERTQYSPGTFSWTDLSTTDQDGAKTFYSGLFGWKFNAFEGGDMPYFTIQNGDASNGGMRAPQPGEPPYWLVYFATEDADAALAKAGELGGSALGPAMDLAMGRIGLAR